MLNAESTSSLPVARIADGIYEIDEYDCASIFVITGEERALVIDTGIGILGLREVIERLTDGKPYSVILSHVHPDHIGGAFQFRSLYLHENDYDPDVIKRYASPAVRREYAEMIRQREQKIYPYDTIRDIPEWKQMPSFQTFTGDYQEFDLGNRIIQCLLCPGHTKGSLTFFDRNTGYLILGDACNGTYLLEQIDGIRPEELAGAAEKALRKIDLMRADIRHIINSHHDYRKFGEPLDYRYLLDTLTALQTISTGDAIFEKQKSALTKSGYCLMFRYGTVTIQLMPSL